jgi:hypothetical protein
VISKKEFEDNVIPKQKNLEIKKSIDYKFLYLPQSYSSTINREGKFVIEPLLDTLKRMVVYGMNDKIKIYLENGTRIRDEKLEKRFQGIQLPKKYIIEAIMERTGAILITNILGYEDKEARDLSIEKRKQLIEEFKIHKEVDISPIQYKVYDNYEEIIKEVQKQKSCVIKSDVGAMELSIVAPLLKLKEKEIKKVKSTCLSARNVVKKIL